MSIHLCALVGKREESSEGPGDPIESVSYRFLLDVWRAWYKYPADLLDHDDSLHTFCQHLQRRECMRLVGLLFAFLLKAGGRPC